MNEIEDVLHKIIEYGNLRFEQGVESSKDNGDHEAQMNERIRIALAKFTEITKALCDYTEALIKESKRGN